MQVDWQTFQEEVRITDIEKDLMYQTELYCTYAALYAEALKNKTYAKWELEKTEAILKDHIRNTQTDSKGKPLSDSKISAIVVQQPEYIQAKEKYIEAEVIELELKLVIDAINMRKDMLRSLSANRREELAQRAFGIDYSAENYEMTKKLQLMQEKLLKGFPNSDIVIEGN